MKQMKVLAIALAVALAPEAAVAQNSAMPATAGKARIQVDANQDGFIDRAEAARMPRLAERFDRMDQDKDGRLSADERPKPRDMRRKRGGHGGWMQRADTDKDGRISRAEAQAMQAKAGDRFEKMDVNKDGYVDRSDMQARVAQKRDAFFVGADSNRDGRLSRDEFVVEQGARNAERREQWARRAAANGKPAQARPAPTLEQQIQRATALFDRMDSDRNGTLTRAEFAAAKPGRQGKSDRSR